MFVAIKDKENKYFSSVQEFNNLLEGELELLFKETDEEPNLYVVVWEKKPFGDFPPPPVLLRINKTNFSGKELLGDNKNLGYWWQTFIKDNKNGS